MILCVNPNAAIDKTVVVDNFHLNAIHRPQSVIALPGGKGCNVARALKTLGEQALVAGWVGGFAGRFIEAELIKEGIRTAFVTVEAESRTCLSILDPGQNTLTEIYEPGAPVPESAIEQFLETYNAILPECSLVTLSGSLPKAVPADFYAVLIELARQAGVPALLDTSGEPLRLGLERGRPALIKPNRNELSDLVKFKMDSLEEYGRLAVELSSRYQTAVVVSLGEAGLVAAEDGRAWRVKPPVVPAVSAVGSGDCLLAGLACGIVRGYSFEETLRLGVAAGAANTLFAGAGRFEMTDVTAILPGITLDELAGLKD